MVQNDVEQLARRIAAEEIGGLPPRCTGHKADRYNAAFNAVVKAAAALHCMSDDTSEVSMVPPQADELRALIKKATQEDLSDDGRYFSETYSDLTRCRHQEIGEYEHGPDGKLVEFLWNNRHDYLARLSTTAGILCRAELKELGLSNLAPAGQKRAIPIVEGAQSLEIGDAATLQEPDGAVVERHAKGFHDGFPSHPTNIAAVPSAVEQDGHAG